MRTAYIVLGSLLFLCLLPVLVALAALALTGPMGCTSDGPALSNCTLFGTDWSGAMTMATMLHWLGIVTLPFAALFALTLLLLALVHLIRTLRR
ncbi:hypothetical protein G5V65_03295 [Rhodobacter sp. HX-7-19]|uniref:Uncharacterized protein n=1 Tax=Paragemmobacter kunshanensis TaxID=2583234 RepID=A0A6M1TJ48_9RHOB|nr:hypothetical protein [Rhodobacter kunshanensis]NGQ89909.1 hypothetical protein [Rhodobacter kunshanensis]